MLSDNNALNWLIGNELAHALSLLRPFPVELMDGYEVSKMVNSPLNDSPDCIAAFDSYLDIDTLRRNQFNPTLRMRRTRRPNVDRRLV